jgi:hypothetical protein
MPSSRVYARANSGKNTSALWSKGLALLRRPGVQDLPGAAVFLIRAFDAVAFALDPPLRGGQQGRCGGQRPSVKSLG